MFNVSSLSIRIPITDIFGSDKKRRKRRQAPSAQFVEDEDQQTTRLVTTTGKTTSSSLSATAAAATAVLSGNNFDASTSAISPATTERTKIGTGLNFGDYDVGLGEVANKIAASTTPASPAGTSPAGKSVLEEDFYNQSPESLSMSTADKQLADEVDLSEVDDDEEYDWNLYNFDYDDEDVYTSGKQTAGNQEDDDELPPEIYCDLVATLEDKCGEYNLLELWKYDEDKIRKLTQQDIIDAVNSVKKSPVFGYPTDFTSYLGNKQYNSTGHVIGAGSIRTVWLATFDPDKVEETEQATGIELDTADPFTMEWELQLIDVLLGMGDELDEEEEGYRLLIHVARSFADITTRAVVFDGIRMVCGYFLMFGYTMFMLGKCNLVEHRSYLALMGLLAVGFGLIISMGITLGLGYPYTPIHGILPFLCLGIGIDDMFVILQCWNNLPDHEKAGRSLPEKMAMTMQHAGVAITVTSVTDVFAFGVGSVTVS